jgi:glycosyltransferase involved in cell wall biosynthesis
VTKGALDLNVIIPIAVLCYGGSEAQTLQLSRTLIKLGCKIEVICFYDYKEDVVKEFEASGATVRLLKHTRGKKFKLLSSLYRLYSQRRPDVVHVQYVEQGFVAMAAAFAAKVPIRFATVHQLGSTYRKFQHLLLHTAARLSTLFLCVSKGAERSWFNDSALWDPTQAGNRRHWTIYNCVDGDLIRTLISTTDLDALKIRYGIGKGPVIGVIGRTSFEKGQSVLLDAFAIVIERIPAATLLVIGEDYQRNELIAQVEMLGLKEKMIMTGRVPKEEVYRLYGIIDVVAVPSRYEGFGLIAAEAMAASRPVVASRVGGLPEIVEDGVTGFLVEQHNCRELAAAILQCLNKPQFAAKLGSTGRRRVAEIFSIDAFDSAIASLYQWAIRRNGLSRHCEIGSDYAIRQNF